jgi:hypothetical protein
MELHAAEHPLEKVPDAQQIRLRRSATPAV